MQVPNSRLRERPRFYRFCTGVANKFLLWAKLQRYKNLRKFVTFAVRVEVAPDAHLRSAHRQLVPSPSAPLANAVCVNGCAATARKSTDGRTLLTTGDAADESTCADPSSSGQLIAVFLPKTSSMLVTIADTSVVRMRDIAVPMAQLAAGSC